MIVLLLVAADTLYCIHVTCDNIDIVYINATVRAWFVDSL